MKSLTRSITNISSILTAIISFIVAISIPAAYFIIAYQYTVGAINTEIRFSARAVEGLVAKNPKSWQFEEIRLQEILGRHLDHTYPDNRIIRDLQGHVIAETREPLARPITTASQFIYDSGIKVARIEIEHSITSLVARTALIGAGSALLGIMLFFLFRFFPLRMVQETFGKLRDSEKRYRMIVENMRESITTTDLNLNYKYQSPSEIHVTGYTAEEIVKIPIKDMLTPESYTVMEKIITEEFEKELSGEPLDRHRSRNIEVEVYHKNGGTIWEEITASFSRDENGKPMEILLVGRNITERKRAEESLWESEQNYRLLASYHRRLNDTSIALTESFSTEELFNKIAESLRLLCGAIAATFAVYDPTTQSLKPVSMSIDPACSDTIRSVFGAAFLEIRIPVSSDAMKQILDQFIRRPRDLYELSNEAVPRELSAAFIDAVGCGQIIALAINYSDELLGTCVAYLPENQPVVPDDALKTFTYLSGMAIKRKRSEETLQDSEKRYRMIVENMHESISTMDLNLDYKYQSPSEIHITGYTAEEIIKIPIKDMLTPESYAIMEKIITEEFEKELSGEPLDLHRSRNIEVEVYHKNGGTIWEEITASFSRDESGKPVEILLVGRDITERKRAEEALRKSEEYYRILANNIPDIIYSLDSEGNIVTINSIAFERYGYSEKSSIGKPFLDFVHPDDREVLINSFLKALEDRRKITTGLKFRIVAENGLVYWFELNARARFDDNFNYLGEEGVLRDITDRKKAEEELQESTRVLFESQKIAGLGTWFLDIPAGVFKTSQGMDELFGIDEAYDHSIEGWAAIIHPDDRAMMIDYLLNEVIGRGQLCDKEFRIVRFNDKTMRWMHALGELEFDANGRPIKLHGTSQDVTERKLAEAETDKLESQLFQAQKMEAIGTLAGGIAHDFNNILGAMIGYTELALMEEDKERRHRDLRAVLNACTRATDLVKQILSFSRKSDVDMKPINIRYIVKEAISLLRSTIPSTIDINYNSSPAPMIILANSTQIHQVIMNLCTNATHAMKQTGGILTIELATLELAPGEILHHPDLRPGPYVRLTVSDTGQGIDSDHLQRIFDPFFTTKSKDEGTGLGLSVVYGIVKSHDGIINVYSEPDKGAVFNIYLPRITSTETMEVDTSIPVTGGKERVLFVDDELPLVNLVTYMLSSLGYEVTGVTSSLEALDMFLTEPRRFDLIITDMTLPKMTGIVLSREILKIRPDIPIILCSGIKESDTEAQAKSLGIRAYCIKPLTRRELARVIRDTLNGHEKQAS